MDYNIPPSKKLWNGKASVRDYIVKKCLESMEPLVVHYQGKTMTIPPDRLVNYTTWNKRTFNSKFGKKSYALFDFTFVEDGKAIPLAVEEREAQIERDQHKLF
jgi:hypothetical protein